MSANLIGNLTSDMLAAQNALAPKSVPDKITVYVESYEDIAFWQGILHEYYSKDREFEILTATQKGKVGALERSNDILSLQAGEYLIICIDSDYDYLLPDLSATSRLINSNPYIFQTYAYALENLQCYSDGLHTVCVSATKHGKKITDFNELLTSVSKIIYPLFLWNVHAKSTDHRLFTISDFCSIVRLIDKVDVIEKCESAIINLQKRVTTKLADLQRAYPDAIDIVSKLGTSLTAKGITEENVYLFIQGHTLKDHIVMKMLRHTCDIMVNEKMREINTNAQHAEQAKVDRNQYNELKVGVALALSLNTNFKSCFLYKKINADLDHYIANFKKAS